MSEESWGKISIESNFNFASHTEAARITIGGGESAATCPIHGPSPRIGFGTTGAFDRQWCVKCFSEAVTELVSKRLWDHARQMEELGTSGEE